MTPRLHVDSCRSCRESVIWCLTEQGKRMPVDVEPVPHGNLTLSDARPTPVATVVSKSGREPGRRLYISHFATCPKSNQHRRKANRQRQKSVPRSTEQPEQGALFGEPRRGRRRSRA